MTGSSLIITYQKVIIVIEKYFFEETPKLNGVLKRQSILLKSTLRSINSHGESTWAQRFSFLWYRNG